MPPTGNCKSHVVLMIEEILKAHFHQLFLTVCVLVKHTARKRKRSENVLPYSMIERIPTQVKHLNRMVLVSDADCILNLRMDRNSFGRLCFLLKHLGGLADGKWVSVEEQVAMFLGILAHHKKNKVVKFNFLRSGQTISHYVHVVLRAILKIHGTFLVKPTPVDNECVDPRWKWFKVL